MRVVEFAVGILRTAVFVAVFRGCTNLARSAAVMGMARVVVERINAGGRQQVCDQRKNDRNALRANHRAHSCRPSAQQNPRYYTRRRPKSEEETQLSRANSQNRCPSRRFRTGKEFFERAQSPRANATDGRCRARASLDTSGSLQNRLVLWLLEMRQEGPWLRQIILNRQRLLEGSLGLGPPVVGGQNYAHV